MLFNALGNTKEGRLCRSLLLLLSVFLVSCGGADGAQPPSASFRVSSIYPADNQIEVPCNGYISVTFSMPLDPSSLQGGGISVTDDKGTQVEGTISLSPGLQRVIFYPTQFLKPLSRHRVAVSDNVRSSSGTGIDRAREWFFCTETAFWALDCMTGMYSLVPATSVDNGAYCRIYLEQGRTVSPEVIASIRSEFDSRIYPGVTSAFGHPPLPPNDADNDSRIVILLLDIRDGFAPGSSTSYIAGYFDPVNEYSYNPRVGSWSNEKEILYMDIYPSNPSNPCALRTVSHELQHLIHWEQKDHNHLDLSGSDETWLNEAMSLVAPGYAGYGPDYDRLYQYEIFGIWRSFPYNQLMYWDMYAPDVFKFYLTKYMWAQYVADNFPPDIFYRMLHNNFVGAASADVAFLQSSYPAMRSFDNVFVDWSIAVLSGRKTWANHPEWSYTSIDTKSGTQGPYVLPGIIPQQGSSNLPPIPEYSFDFFRYVPIMGSMGTVEYQPGTGMGSASLYDIGGDSIIQNLLGEHAYVFTDQGILIARSRFGISSGNGVIQTRSSGSTIPRVAIEEGQALGNALRLRFGQSPVSPRSPVRSSLVENGNTCINDILIAHEEHVRRSGLRPRF